MPSAGVCFGPDSSAESERKGGRLDLREPEAARADEEVAGVCVGGHDADDRLIREYADCR